jgi:hypothetical protein
MRPLPPPLLLFLARAHSASPQTFTMSESFLRSYIL